MGSNCCKGDAAGRPIRATSSIYSRSRAGASLDERFTSSEDAGGVRLTITAARTGDSGVYTLQASNAAGKDTARVRLEVAEDEAPVGDDPPSFLRRLQDLTVKVGTRTRFLVEIVSSTECKVTWYRNERRLLEAERVSLARDGNFWCADLSAVSVDDAGRWTCTAENAGGRASCSAHLNVLVPKAYKRPEFVEELRALLTEQGTVSLECKVVGVPTPVLRWFKDSREIKAGDVFALTANAEDPTSLGTYTCEAVNCMGRSYSSSKVHVVGRGSREASTRPPSSLSAEPPPIFTKELEDQVVKVTEPLTLSCHIVVPPWPRSVVWYNKEGKIEPSEKYHVLEDGVGGYLVEAPSAEWPDEGEWKCVATSAGGRVGISTCHVTMDVPKNYRKPRFMENLQAVLTEEGLVSFECKVVGFPTPVLSWFKDGQELKPGDVYQLTGTNSLGSYCCIARNCMGQASSSAELTVEDIQNQLNEEEKLQLFAKNQAPKFLTGLKSVEAKIDEPFRFTVKVAIPPDPSVLWYRDDQPVDESPRCHLSREEKGAFSLDIQNLEFLDQAEWKCVAMNDFGHSVTSCFLKLIIPRHYKKPRFLENLQAILSDEGAVNLECKVIGVPQPVLKWYKDGEELKPGDIHRIISGQDGTCCLGTYTCEAQNCMGIAASSASLLGLEDSMKAKSKRVAEEQALERNLSLSTIHEERTSQMYDTPVGDITLDEKGEISFSFDGKEVSVSLYETPDLTEEEALQIVEMYADQLSENVTEHNVVELPPLRFVKETSTSGNLLMEAIIIDVSPDYFVTPEEDLRTEADVEDLSIADENGPPQLSLDQDIEIGGEDYLEKTMSLLSDEKADIPIKPIRKKSDSQRSGEDYFSLSRDQTLSEEKKDDDTKALSETEIQSFASARSSSKPKSKVSKLSVEGPESSDISNTVLHKEDIQKESPSPAARPRRERRGSRSSRRSSSASEKSFGKISAEISAQDQGKEQVEAPTVISELEYNSKLTQISSSLTTVINDLQVIERDIILKSELMSSAATASRSLELISGLITPLSELHSITEATKGAVTEPVEVRSTLLNNLPQSLKLIQQSCTMIEKCIEIERDSKTLVKKTCLAIVDACSDNLQKVMNDVNSLVKQYEPRLDERTLTETDLIASEIVTVLKLATDTIKTKDLLSEAKEIKVDEPTVQTNHLRQTQKAVFELKTPLNSLLCIAENAVSGKLAEFPKLKRSDVILNDMSESIQDLQTALEQIETLSIKESASDLNKYNTIIIETVMDSVLKLRSSFEQLSLEAEKEEDADVLNQALASIKQNLMKISSHIDSIERSVGTFDILHSDNKLEVLQRMAQILIALENNLSNLETMPEFKSSMALFHKNLTRVLENVIEGNESKKYFALMEICDVVNRVNTSLKTMDLNILLSLASLSNSMKIIRDNFIHNVFESELNCVILNNLADILVGIQEVLNNPEETSLLVESDKVQEISTPVFDESKTMQVIEHINHFIAMISEVKLIESTASLQSAITPTLENICPVLEELRRFVAIAHSSEVNEDDSLRDISDASTAETLAIPLCELNQNIIVLNHNIEENLESLKKDNSVATTLAEPLHELYTALEVLQQDIVSQYGDMTPFDVSVNMASAVKNLHSCILLIEDQQGVEATEDMSTLDDVSGIKTTAEVMTTEPMAVPTAQETTIEAGLTFFDSEQPPTSTVDVLNALNEHVAILQSPDVVDALDSLSEVSDFSSLKSVIPDLNELHTAIEEFLHPIVMENSLEQQNSVNTLKLLAIAKPMQDIHNCLSVLDIDNIPLYENLLDMPADKMNTVLKDINNFKDRLEQCIHVIYSSIETTDTTVEISSKVEKLRSVCENMKNILSTKVPEFVENSVQEEAIKKLETVIDSILNVSDVSQGINVDNLKRVSEEVYGSISVVQEELLKFSSENPQAMAQEAIIIDAIDKVERSIAVLEEFDFVDLSKASDLGSSAPMHKAIEMNTEKLEQIDDVVENIVSVLIHPDIKEPTADMIKVEEFINRFRNELTIMKCLLSKQLSHKKIIRLLQEFMSLQLSIKEFKVESNQLNLSDEVRAKIGYFTSEADGYLKDVENTLVSAIHFQWDLLCLQPLNKVNNTVHHLQGILKFNQDDTEFCNSVNRLLNILQSISDSARACCKDLEELIIEDITNFTHETTLEENQFKEKMESLEHILKQEIADCTQDKYRNMLQELSDCINFHSDFKKSVGTGRSLIILKCLSECSDILEHNIANEQLVGTENTPRSVKESDSKLKMLLSDIIDPLRTFQEQLKTIQKVEQENKNIATIDLTPSKCCMNTLREVYREISQIEQKIKDVSESADFIDNDDVFVLMNVDKEIHVIKQTVYCMENSLLIDMLTEVAQPIEEIEKSLHNIIASSAVRMQIKDIITSEKSVSLFKEIENAVSKDIIDTVEEINVVLNLKELAQSAVISRDLKENVVLVSSETDSLENTDLLESLVVQIQLVKKLKNALTKSQVVIMDNTDNILANVDPDTIRKAVIVTTELQDSLSTIEAAQNDWLTLQVVEKTDEKENVKLVKDVVTSLVSENSVEKSEATDLCVGVESQNLEKTDATEVQLHEEVLKETDLEVGEGQSPCHKEDITIEETNLKSDVPSPLEEAPVEIQKAPATVVVGKVAHEHKQDEDATKITQATIPAARDIQDTDELRSVDISSVDTIDPAKLLDSLLYSIEKYTSMDLGRAVEDLGVFVEVNAYTGAVQFARDLQSTIGVLVASSFKEQSLLIFAEQSHSLYNSLSTVEKHVLHSAQGIAGVNTDIFQRFADATFELQVVLNSVIQRLPMFTVIHELAVKPEADEFVERVDSCQISAQKPAFESMILEADFQSFEENNNKELTLLPIKAPAEILIDSQVPYQGQEIVQAEENQSNSSEISVFEGKAKGTINAESESAKGVIQSVDECSAKSPAMVELKSFTKALCVNLQEEREKTTNITKDDNEAQDQTINPIDTTNSVPIIKAIDKAFEENKLNLEINANIETQIVILQPIENQASADTVTTNDADISSADIQLSLHETQDIVSLDSEYFIKALPAAINYTENIENGILSLNDETVSLECNEFLKPSQTQVETLTSVKPTYDISLIDKAVAELRATSENTDAGPLKMSCIDGQFIDRKEGGSEKKSHEVSDGFSEVIEIKAQDNETFKENVYMNEPAIETESEDLLEAVKSSTVAKCLVDLVMSTISEIDLDTKDLETYLVSQPDKVQKSVLRKTSLEAIVNDDSISQEQKELQETGTRQPDHFVSLTQLGTEDLVSELVVKDSNENVNKTSQNTQDVTINKTHPAAGSIELNEKEVTDHQVISEQSTKVVNSSQQSIEIINEDYPIESQELQDLESITVLQHEVMPVKTSDAIQIQITVNDLHAKEQVFDEINTNKEFPLLIEDSAKASEVLDLDCVIVGDEVLPLQSKETGHDTRKEECFVDESILSEAVHNLGAVDEIKLFDDESAKKFIESVLYKQIKVNEQHDVQEPDLVETIKIYTTDEIFDKDIVQIGLESPLKLANVGEVTIHQEPDELSLSLVEALATEQVLEVVNRIKCKEPYDTNQIFASAAVNIDLGNDDALAVVSKENSCQSHKIHNMQPSSKDESFQDTKLQVGGVDEILLLSKLYELFDPNEGKDETLATIHMESVQTSPLQKDFSAEKVVCHVKPELENIFELLVTDESSVEGDINQTDKALKLEGNKDDVIDNSKVMSNFQEVVKVIESPTKEIKEQRQSKLISVEENRTTSEVIGGITESLKFAKDQITETFQFATNAVNAVEDLNSNIAVEMAYHVLEEDVGSLTAPIKEIDKDVAVEKVWNDKCIVSEELPVTAAEPIAVKDLFKEKLNQVRANIEVLVSDHISETVKEIAEIIHVDEIKETLNVAIELRECMNALETQPNVLESTAQLTHEKDDSSHVLKLELKLQNALSVLQANVLHNTQNIEEVTEAEKLFKVIEVVSHLQEDLAVAIVSQETEPLNVLSSAGFETQDVNSMKQLESLLKEVSEKIDVSTTGLTDGDNEDLRDTLDEVQTVIIKLRRDYDGAENDSLNEILEDLECSVRSVQLQITENSPPKLLKEACATLSLLVNNITETPVAQLKVKQSNKTEKMLESCSDETQDTVDLIELAVSQNEQSDSKLDDIVKSMKILKDTMLSLRLSFLGNSESLIEKGIDVNSCLQKVEDQVYYLEKEISSETNVSSEIKDSILTAIHSVFGSISNMRGTITSIQKQYLYDHYGKPTEKFLKSIKNITAISKYQKNDEEILKWHKISESLRKIMSNFEDIKFYVNLDKTARLPSDSVFTRNLLDELKHNILKLNIESSSFGNSLKVVTEHFENIQHSLDSISSNIDCRQTLEVKEKIPIYSAISIQIYELSESVLNYLKIQSLDLTVDREEAEVPPDDKIIQEKSIGLSKASLEKETLDIDVESMEIPPPTVDEEEPSTSGQKGAFVDEQLKQVLLTTQTENTQGKLLADEATQKMPMSLTEKEKCFSAADSETQTVDQDVAGKTTTQDAINETVVGSAESEILDDQQSKIEQHAVQAKQSIGTRKTIASYEQETEKSPQTEALRIEQDAEPLTIVSVQTTKETVREKLYFLENAQEEVPGPSRPRETDLETKIDVTQMDIPNEEEKALERLNDSQYGEIEEYEILENQESEKGIVKLHTELKQNEEKPCEYSILKNTTQNVPGVSKGKAEEALQRVIETDKTEKAEVKDTEMPTQIYEHEDHKDDNKFTEVNIGEKDDKQQETIHIVQEQDQMNCPRKESLNHLEAEEKLEDNISKEQVPSSSKNVDLSEQVSEKGQFEKEIHEIKTNKSLKDEKRGKKQVKEEISQYKAPEQTVEDNRQTEKAVKNQEGQKKEEGSIEEKPLNCEEQKRKRDDSEENKLKEKAVNTRIEEEKRQKEEADKQRLEKEKQEELKNQKGEDKRKQHEKILLQKEDVEENLLQEEERNKKETDSQFLEDEKRSKEKDDSQRQFDEENQKKVEVEKQRIDEGKQLKEEEEKTRLEIETRQKEEAEQKLKENKNKFDEEKRQKEEAEEKPLDKEKRLKEAEMKLIEEEERQKGEAEKNRLNEEKRLKEETEKNRLDEERRLKEEEEKSRLEEKNRLKEEAEKKRLDEEMRLKEEEVKRQIEEAEKNRLDEERRLKEEEEKRRLENEKRQKEEAEKNRLNEEKRLKEETEKNRLDEERRLKEEEEKSRLEEKNRLKEEAEKKRLDEEMRLKEEEVKRQIEDAEKNRLDEERRLKEEEEKRRLENEKRQKEEAEKNRLNEEKRLKEETEKNRLDEERRLKEEEEKSHLEEKNRLKEEAEKKRLDEEMRLKEEEVKRQKEEAEKNRLDEERRLKEEEEKRRLENEKRQKEEAEKNRLNEEKRLKEETEKNRLDEERRLKEEEEKSHLEEKNRLKEEAEKKRLDEEMRFKEEEVKRQKEEAEKNRLDEERRLKEEEEKRRLENEKRQKEEAEKNRLNEEKRLKEETEKNRLDEERTLKEEEEKSHLEEKNRLKEEAEKKRLDEEMRFKEEEEKRQKEEAEKNRLDEERRLKEEEEKRRLENEKRQKEEAEKNRLNEEKRLKEETEKNRLDEERRLKEEEEKSRLEEKNRLKEEAEKKRLDEEMRLKEEEEKRQKEEAEKNRLDEERRLKEEEEKSRLEEENRLKEEAEKKRLDEEIGLKEEEEKRQKEEADKNRLDEENRFKEVEEKLFEEEFEKSRLDEERLLKELEEKRRLEEERRLKEEEEMKRIEDKRRLKVEEENLLKEEAEKKRIEKEKRLKEGEEKRLKEEAEKRIEEEKRLKEEAMKKKIEEERRLKEEEKRLIEVAEKKRIEQEKRFKEKEEKLLEEEAEKKLIKEERRLKEEEEKLRKEEAEKNRLEEVRRLKEGEQKRLKEEVEKKRSEEEKRLKEEVEKRNEEEKRLKEEAEKKLIEEEKRQKDETEENRLNDERRLKEEEDKRLEKEKLLKEEAGEKKRKEEKKRFVKEKRQKDEAEKKRLEEEKLQKDEAEKKLYEEQKQREQEDEKNRLIEQERQKEEVENKRLGDKKQQLKLQEEDDKKQIGELKRQEEVEEKKRSEEELVTNRIESQKRKEEKADVNRLEEEKRQQATAEKKRFEDDKCQNKKSEREKRQKDEAKNIGLDENNGQTKEIKNPLINEDKRHEEDTDKSLKLETEKLIDQSEMNKYIQDTTLKISKSGKDRYFNRNLLPLQDNLTQKKDKLDPRAEISERKLSKPDQITRDKKVYQIDPLHNEYTERKRDLPTFSDRNHRDYTMEFARPSNYREKTINDVEVHHPEISYSRGGVTIYKAKSILQEAQLRSSLPPPTADTRRHETYEVPETERAITRQRAKTHSEARSYPEKRCSMPRDLRRKPVFSTHLTDRTAVEGSRVKLTCSVLCTTDTKITWYKNGVVLDNKLKYRTKFSDGLITLEVLNAVPTDSAEYSCVVENENGSVSSSATLKVYPSFEATPIPPTFTRSIRDTYHLAENELILECRIRGQPLPTITWLKDNKPIETKDRYQSVYLADGVCRLAISHPTPEDSGNYTCKAENLMWSDSISHFVSFTGKESRCLSPNLTTIEKSRFSRQAHEYRRPHFANVLSDHTVVSGGTIGLQVEIRGAPTRVEWLREGRPVTETYRNAKAFEEHELYTLALTDVTESETGTYTCRAWSNHGIVDMNAAVTVVPAAGKEGKPAIIVGRPEKDVLISVGEDINISFRVHGEPKPKVILMKGTRDITNSQRVCKMTSDDYVKFTLKRSVVSDAGTYCILARNAYGCDRSFVTVVVRQRASSENLVSDWTYPDDASFIISSRNNKAVPERISREPTLADSGNNWLSLAWPKPEAYSSAPVLAYKVESWQLGKEGGARWVEVGITPLNSFDVFNLKQGEEYHFRVTPKNRYGWGESVQTSKPIGVGLSGTQPEFVEILPGQLKVLVGEKASLCCVLQGKPTPEVVWMKNGHEVEEEPGRVSTAFDGQHCRLTIDGIQPEDEARYSCEAANANGRSSTYARLAVVTDKAVWEADAKLKRERSADIGGEYPPQFTMRLRDRRVQATYPVRLTCQVVGSPKPQITWYRDGHELAADDRHSMCVDEHFHTLEIGATRLEDGGVYEAVARNTRGAVGCRCCLVVDKGIRAYVAPEFCLGLDPLYRVNEGEELRVCAVVEAYPSVGVTWYRDGVRLRPSRRAVMTLDRDGGAELALAGVTSRDAGVYSCTATNEVGSATTSTRIEVVGGRHPHSPQRPTPIVMSPDEPYSKEPMFIKKPRSSTAREGDTVIIECEVIGDPKPDVYWLRDFLKPDYYRDASHFKRVGAGPEYRFEIPHAKLDYTGAYSVVARNVHGEVKAIISLQILARDTDSTSETHNVKYGRVDVIPRFRRELTDLLCCDGDDVEFHCEVDGDPAPDIKWFRYGELIRESNEYEMCREGNAARLRVRQVAAEDEGVYACEAANSLGKATCAACLVVYPPGEPNTLSQQLRRPPALSTLSTPRSTPRATPARSLSATPAPEPRRPYSPSRQVAPKFYTYPHNKVVEEGAHVRFQCAVAGHPAPWASWDKEGVLVTPSARLSVREKDDMRILEIEEVTIEDAGLYRITLENDYGRVEACARLDVISHKGKFYGGVRAYSASPRRAAPYRRQAAGAGAMRGPDLGRALDSRHDAPGVSKWAANNQQDMTEADYKDLQNFFDDIPECNNRAVNISFLTQDSEVEIIDPSFEDFNGYEPKEKMNWCCEDGAMAGEDAEAWPPSSRHRSCKYACYELLQQLLQDVYNERDCETAEKHRLGNPILEMEQIRA